MIGRRRPPDDPRADAETTFQRKLVAILAADVVGYSRLMEADEVGTLRRLQAIHRTCITPKVAAHGGRLIKTTGDGFLFEFSSAIEAVLIGVGLQQQVQAAMASVADETKLVFRIGVHAGDVLSDGVDMFGDGVNVAARLETLCTPGGLCMSAVVHEQLRGKVELPLVDLGAHQVKNISRSIHVFGIDAGAIGSVSTAGLGGTARTILKTNRRWMAMALVLVALVAVGLGAWLVRHQLFTPAGSQDLSLAVLPFTTIVGDEKQGAFADALVDNIATNISISVPGLTVISTASTFTYKGKSVDPRTIGRELGVGYVLEGNVQKDGNRLRVKTQLVATSNAAELWSDEFDGDLANFAELQDQITGGIANTLQIQLKRIEAKRRLQMADGSALDLILEGEAILTRPITVASLDAAAALFRQALVLDPGNLTATTDLATVLAQSVSAGNGDKAQAELDEANKLLDKVEAEDPRFPALHNTLGIIDLITQRPRDAIEQFRREIAIDRNAAAAYSNLGASLTTIGRPAEGIPLIEKSLRLNPRNPNIWAEYLQLMWANFGLQKYPEARQWAQKAAAANSQNPTLPLMLAALDVLQGDQPSARSNLADALKLSPGLTIGAMRARIASKEAFTNAMADRFYDALHRAGLPD